LPRKKSMQDTADRHSQWPPPIHRPELAPPARPPMSRADRSLVVACLSWCVPAIATIPGFALTQMADFWFLFAGACGPALAVAALLLARPVHREISARWAIGLAIPTLLVPVLVTLIRTFNP